MAAAPKVVCGRCLSSDGVEERSLVPALARTLSYESCFFVRAADAHRFIRLFFFEEVPNAETKQALVTRLRAKRGLRMRSNADTTNAT
ncbi:hypothetical protein EVAR_88109_1 [Eumeta japonica]|uniref:Uncharacterized protein n=1 Tax=Eumeta variegata TaxID=151549 RepID=A0A4C2A769_EUMVA|nr:hypothetical protein EVAR_88109_1 [Eumeta japonica]